MKKIARCLVIVLTLAATPFFSALASSTPPGSFADLTEKLLPSVVNISTTQILSQRDDLPEMEFQFPEGSPFEHFFKDFMEQQRELAKPGAKPRKQKATSLGSGFIIDPAGYIVTNDHVIQDADEITVILQDDTNLKATVVGRDKKTDLALLKVESKKPLPSLTFGDSDKVRVGDWIVAIGNPYGLGGTVTAGIISARARNINSGPYDDFLQTDASINRGNSGGPLFDMNGAVVGINTAIFSPTGGSVGIGFAIPANMAKGVIEQLKTLGHTRRGWIGVKIQTVTPEIAKGLGLDAPRGALVSGVTENGPAAKAGVTIGDVIVAFDDKDVPEMQRLPRIVAETPVDKSAPMKIVRKGHETTVNVKVGELANDDEDAPLEELDASGKKGVKTGERIETLGITVAPLTPLLRKRYSVSDNTTVGVVVLALEDDGLAGESDLREGDVISQATQKDVPDGKTLEKIAAQAKKEDKPLLLLVERGGEMRFLALGFKKK